MGLSEGLTGLSFHIFKLTLVFQTILYFIQIVHAQYSILFTAIIIILLLYSNYFMSSLCFLTLFIFYIALLKETPVTAAVIVVLMTTNPLLDLS